jgi:hypothetical protein
MARRSRPWLRLATLGLLALALLLQAGTVLAFGGCDAMPAATTGEAAEAPPCHPPAPAPADADAADGDGTPCLAGDSTWCAWACSLVAADPPALPAGSLLTAPESPVGLPTPLATRTLPVPQEPPRA